MSFSSNKKNDSKFFSKDSSENNFVNNSNKLTESELKQIHTYREKLQEYKRFWENYKPLENNPPELVKKEQHLNTELDELKDALSKSVVKKIDELTESDLNIHHSNTDYANIMLNATRDLLNLHFGNNEKTDVTSKKNDR